MIDVAIAFAPAADLVALDLWDGDLPDLAGVRALQVEPRRWWLVDGEPHIAMISAALGEHGALTAFGGGIVRAVLHGPGWRDLLSISGLFDTHDPGFAPGSVASTVIHHVPVRIAILSADMCEVYCAASYAPTLQALWETSSA